MKRDLYRLSAVFELADKELNSIVTSASEIQRWGGIIELDDDTLLAESGLERYIDIGPQLSSLAARLEANAWEVYSDASPDELRSCIEAAHRVGAFTVAELDWVLTQLDSRAFGILNHITSKTDAGGIEKSLMIQVLLITFKPELFPEQKELLEMIRDAE